MAARSGSRNPKKKTGSGGKGAAPNVSVVVVSHGDPELLATCLAALRSAPPDGTALAEVIAAAAAPSPEIAAVATEHEARLVSGSGEASSALLNAALSTTTGEFVAFLDDDVSVRQRWARAMIKTLNGNPGAGIAAGKLLDRDGLVLQAGYEFDADSPTAFDARHAGRVRNHFSVLQQTRVAAASFAFAMISRPTLALVGGFDERLDRALADVDFCLRARAGGATTWFSGGAEATRTQPVRAGDEAEADPALVRRWLESFDAFFTRWAAEASWTSGDLAGLRDYSVGWQQEHFLPPSYPEALR